ncbi:MAG: hypothetical protein Q4F95_04130 [Oscillospiraceae bacterium]|nr:hypothetical protein [Oscillospiraceae bacterium]
MIDSFLISFRLKNTYRTNSFIYSLKSLPFIRKLLPASLYANTVLKTLINILSAVTGFLTMFIGKAVYLLIVWLLVQIMKAPGGDSFANMLIFLTLIGGIINTQLFDPSKDKFYAMFIMRMDSREYILTNFMYFLLRTFIGFIPSALIFGSLSGACAATCLCIPVYAVSIKLCFAAVGLRDYTSKVKKETSKKEILIKCISSLVLLALSASGFTGYVLGEKILWIISAAVLIPAAIALRYIICFKFYRNVSRKLLRHEQYADVSYTKTMAEAQQISMQKKIIQDTSLTSSKSGYKYFNELFMKRHARLLTKSAKRITAAAAVLLAASAAAVMLMPATHPQIRSVLMNYLPYFLFLMYLINRGKVITQAMFMNCDHSMLTYRFYRKPEALLKLFAHRLRYVVLINLMPAAVIATGLPLLLYLTGGTDEPLNYLVLFISIIAMSVFFSVHNMVMYYLLQPYNVNMESRNAAYGVVNWVTYMVCYVFVQTKMPTLIFGAAVSAFCIIYIAVALILAYRLAPKTFRLRN